MQGADELDALIGALKEKQQRLADLHGKLVPLALKIAPDLDDEQIKAIADTLLRHSIEGVIATNTTLARAGLSSHLEQAGGASGAILSKRALEVVTRIARTAPRLTLIAAGGVMTKDDAQRRYDAGARLVQIYTGLVFGGPGIVKRIVRTTTSGR